jgi:hypothetical protein
MECTLTQGRYEQYIFDLDDGLLNKHDRKLASLRTNTNAGVTCKAITGAECTYLPVQWYWYRGTS